MQSLGVEGVGTFVMRRALMPHDSWSQRITVRQWALLRGWLWSIAVYVGKQMIFFLSIAVVAVEVGVNVREDQSGSTRLVETFNALKHLEDAILRLEVIMNNVD